jgi:hypothetical protein
LDSDSQEAGFGTVQHTTTIRAGYGIYYVREDLGTVASFPSKRRFCQ